MADCQLYYQLAMLVGGDKKIEFGVSKVVWVGWL